MSLLQIDSGAFFSDHYPVLFEFILTDQLQLLGSKPQMCYSCVSIQSVAKFRGYWFLFSFQTHPYYRIDEFYSHIHTAITLCLERKESKLIQILLHLTYFFCHNRVGTLERLCVRKLISKNLAALDNLRKSLKESIELDRISLLNGCSFFSASHCFELLRSIFI